MSRPHSLPYQFQHQAGWRLTLSFLTASHTRTSRSLLPSRSEKIQAKIDTSFPARTQSLRPRHRPDMLTPARQAVVSEMAFAICSPHQRRTKSVLHPRWTFEQLHQALRSLLIHCWIISQQTASSVEFHSSLRLSCLAVPVSGSRLSINAERQIVQEEFQARLSNLKFHYFTFLRSRVCPSISCLKV